MPEQTMRIGLFGLFGCGNLGNDGSLEAMVATLRRVCPNAELVAIANGVGGRQLRAGIPKMSRTIGKLPGILNLFDVALLRIPRHVVNGVRALLTTRKLDLLLVPGTGILDDFGTGPMGMPLFLFAWCLAARISGTRIGFISIGAGPIRHPASRWLMKRAASFAVYRSYRDTLSKRYLHSIGFEFDDEIYPDLVFGLPLPEPRPEVPPLPRTIGVGIMNYQGWQKHTAGGWTIFTAYAGKMTEFIVWLLDQGYKVRLIMGDTVDEVAVAFVRARVMQLRPGAAADRLLSEGALTFAELLRQIDETNLVVATRFHNIVGALKLGKPAISIGYAGKNEALQVEMGLGAFCQNIETLSVDVLKAQFEALVPIASSQAMKIAEASARYAADLRAQEGIALARLLRPGRSTPLSP